METVYGKYRDGLVRTLEDLTKRIEGYNKENIEAGNEPLYYHLITRIKSEDSMTAKLDARGLAHTPEEALSGSVHDACGYRSYHMIISVEEPYEDAKGNTPGIWYAEIQLRTIAMDSWAALEHQMKYKKTVSDNDLIVAELRRCADELAACDVSMQTISDMINNQ